MSEANRGRRILIAVAIVAIVAVGGLLFYMAGTRPTRADRRASAKAEDAAPAKSRRTRRSRTLGPVRRSPERRPAMPFDPSPALPEKTETAGPSKISRRARAQAPAAIPSEIRQEKDPVKRARLLRMHQIATTKIRAAMLRRRYKLLEKTVERARKDTSLPRERVKQLEAELVRLRRAVKTAEAEYERVKPPVAGE